MKDEDENEVMTDDEIIEIVQARKAGKPIEFRHRGASYLNYSEMSQTAPFDFINFRYRIGQGRHYSYPLDQAPNVVYRWAYVSRRGGIRITEMYHSEADVAKWSCHRARLDWTATFRGQDLENHHE